MKNTAIIVLAAGKGSRMGSEIPKPLVELNGKPVIKHLLDSIEESGLADNLTIVVGNQAELMKETLGPGYNYVLQTKQLGTGHAVKVCRESLEGKVESIVVLYADHPFVDSQTIKNLALTQQEKNVVISTTSITVPDFEDWRLAMYSFSRVKRDSNGNLAAVVEMKDASEAELQIKEVFPAFFCFDAKWLWENLETVKNSNAQGEYYLTELIEIAFEQQEKIACLDADLRAAVGINTKEELALAEKLIDGK